MFSSTLACAGSTAAPGSTGDSTGVVATGDSTTADTTSTSAVTSSTSTSGTTDAESTTLAPADTECLREPSGCNPYLQDCPAGEKCAPTPTEMCGYWNATVCMPVPPDPGQVLEPCQGRGGAYSTSDDCDVGLVCWLFSDAWEGTCVPLCGGSPEAPTCPEWFTCATTEADIHVCRPMCDPLVQDCSDGYTCQQWGLGFVCTAVRGSQAAGEPCGPNLDCEPGARCVNQINVPGCADTHCCTSYCDLTAPDPSASCLPGQPCVPYEDDPQNVLPEFDHVGVCL